MFNKPSGIGVWTVPAFCGAALSASTVFANPDDSAWNQFRGPDSSGVARASRPPVKIDASSVFWKRPIPPGLSSPVLPRNRIFLTAVEADRLVTLAFDSMSGKPAWSQPAPDVPAEKVHEVNSPATPTP